MKQCMDLDNLHRRINKIIDTYGREINITQIDGGYEILYSFDIFLISSTFLTMGIFGKTIIS